MQVMGAAGITTQDIALGSGMSQEMYDQASNAYEMANLASDAADTASMVASGLKTPQPKQPAGSSRIARCRSVDTFDLFARRWFRPAASSSWVHSKSCPSNPSVFY